MIKEHVYEQYFVNSAMFAFGYIYAIAGDLHRDIPQIFLMVSKYAVMVKLFCQRKMRKQRKDLMCLC